jgi:hypothetical protein
MCIKTKEIKETLTPKIETSFNNYGISLNTKYLTKSPVYAHGHSSCHGHEWKSCHNAYLVGM